MKPNPIPDLEGEAARVFEKNIRDAPTSTQKRIMREAAEVYSQTKTRK